MKSKLNILIENIFQEEVFLLKEGSREPSKEQIDATMELLRNTIKDTKFAGKVFVAGGAVRDMVMGIDPKDIDLVVELEDGGLEFAKFIAQKLGIYKPGSNPVEFPRFGTAKVAFDKVVYKGISLEGIDVEVVATREEEYEPGSRKPTTRFGTIKQDVFRRDFTINTLLMDLLSGEIVDLTGKGREDIAKRVIRTPSEPNRIFNDDPLRLLRAVRFAGRYGYTVPDFMRDSIRKNASMLKVISSERIKEEFEKILKGANPDVGVKLLYDLGLMPYSIPQLVGKEKDAIYGARIGKGFLGKFALMLKNIPLPEVKKIGRQLKLSIEEENAIYNIVEAMQSIERDSSSANILKAGTDLVNRKLGNYIELIEPLDIKVKQLKPYFLRGPIVHIRPDELMSKFGIKPGPQIGKLVKLQKDLWYQNPDITKEEVYSIIEREI